MSKREDACHMTPNDSMQYEYRIKGGKVETADLGDALDVVTKDLAMALGSSLSESLSSFASSRHC